MGISAAHCQGNVREFQSVWRVVTLFFIFKHFGLGKGPGKYFYRGPGKVLDFIVSKSVGTV